MSRIFPGRKIQDAQVLDPEDWRKAWGPFQDHIGSLNEHNLRASSWAAMHREDDYEADVRGNKSAGLGNVTDSRLAALYELDHTSGDTLFGVNQWMDIPSEEEIIRHDSGIARVFLDAQYLTGIGLRPVSLKFGVTRNGTLISESVVGGMDMSWEPANMEQGVGHLRSMASIAVSFPVPSGTSVFKGVFYLQVLGGHPLQEKKIDGKLTFYYSNLRARVSVR